MGLKVQEVKNSTKVLRFLSQKGCCGFGMRRTHAPFRLYYIALWKLSKLSICFALAQYGKGETSEEVFRKLSGNHRRTMDVEVFTDGSKMGDRVRADVFNYFRGARQ